MNTVIIKTNEGTLQKNKHTQDTNNFCSCSYGLPQFILKLGIASELTLFLTLTKIVTSPECDTNWTRRYLKRLYRL